MPLLSFFHITPFFSISHEKIKKKYLSKIIFLDISVFLMDIKEQILTYIECVVFVKNCD